MSATKVGGAEQVQSATVTDVQVAAANKDGTTATPSMRTLGTGAQQAAAGTHAAQHQNGGADEVATAVPVANGIPKALATGKLAAGWIPSSPVALTQVEVDFGSAGVRSKSFTITDASVSGTSKIIPQQAGDAPTGRQADENEMDAILFSAAPGAGQFTLFGNALNGPVSGKYKVNYMVG